MIYESPEGIEHLAKMLREAYKAGREDELAYSRYFAMLNTTVLDQHRALRICFSLADQVMTTPYRENLTSAGNGIEVYSDEDDLRSSEEMANLFLNEVAYDARTDAQETFVAVAMEGGREELVEFVNTIVSFSCQT